MHTHEGLQEMSIGEWEDLPFRELADRYDFFNRIRQDLDHAAPGGESLNDVAARVTDAFRHIDARHGDDETVLVVSHGVAMAVALAVFIDDDAAKWVSYQFNNCSLTQMELSPQPLLHTFNEYAHL